MAIEIQELHRLRDRAASLNKQMNKDVKAAKKYNWVDLKEFMDTVNQVMEIDVGLEDRVGSRWIQYNDAPSIQLLNDISSVYPELEHSLVTVTRLLHEWGETVPPRLSGEIRNALITHARFINKMSLKNTARALHALKRDAGLRRAFELVAKHDVRGATVAPADREHEAAIRQLHEMAVRFEGVIQNYKDELLKKKEYAKNDIDEFIGNMEVILRGLEVAAGEADEALYYFWQTHDRGVLPRMFGLYDEIERYYEASKKLENNAEKTVPSNVRQKIRMVARGLIRDINKMTLDTIEKVSKFRGSRESLRRPRGGD